MNTRMKTVFVLCVMLYVMPSHQGMVSSPRYRRSVQDQYEHDTVKAAVNAAHVVVEAAVAASEAAHAVVAAAAAKAAKAAHGAGIHITAAAHWTSLQDSCHYKVRGLHRTAMPLQRR